MIIGFIYSILITIICVFLLISNHKFKIKKHDYEFLYDHINDHIVFIMLKQKDIVYINPYCGEMTGYTREDFRKQPSIFEKLVHPDDWPIYEFRLKYPELSEKPLVMRWIKKDGSVIWTEHQYTNIYNKKGKMIAVEGTIKDITAQKEKEFALHESEEKFRELFKNAHDMLLLLKYDKDTDSYRIIEVNDDTCNKLQYTKDELIDTDPINYVDDEWKEKYKISVEKLIKIKHENYEIAVLTRSGDKILVDLSASMFKLNMQRFILLVARDITEKKQLQSEVEKTLKLESLSVLSGGIAHDFNNLLTAILGNISLIRLNIDKDSSIFSNLTETESVVYKAKELTKQLLSFSRGYSLDKKTGDVSSLVKNTALFLSRGTGIKCEIDILSDNNFSEYDESQIVQLVNNLVLNAAQAMNNSGILSIKIENVCLKEWNKLNLNAGDYIKISFKDTGSGIQPENISKIFDPFFTTKKNGSGLGLASSFSIVKKHNGTITVESQPDNGSIFIIYLPAMKKDIVVLQPSEKQETIVGGSGTILMMDDDIDIRNISDMILKYLGYVVDMAENGEKTIELYKNKMKSGSNYDIVILDLTIQGGMGGIETIGKLLEIDPEVTAIVSSGYSQDDAMSDYKKFGFCDFVPKPYTVENLSKILKRVIENKKRGEGK